MSERRGSEPETTGRINQQAELLQVCRLELWAEIEGQLDVLRSALNEIETMRDACIRGDAEISPMAIAEALSRQVQTMKGWVRMLDATVDEADGTVERLVLLLKTT